MFRFRKDNYNAAGAGSSSQTTVHGHGHEHNHKLLNQKQHNSLARNMSKASNTHRLSIEVRPKSSGGKHSAKNSAGAGIGNSNTVTTTTVSTLSSMSDIIRCVSEANANANVNTSSNTGKTAKSEPSAGPAISSASAKLGSKLFKLASPVKNGITTSITNGINGIGSLGNINGVNSMDSDTESIDSDGLRASLGPELASKSVTTTTTTTTINNTAGTITKKQSCISCGSKLEIPLDVKHYKCSICDTYRDLKVDSAKEQPPEFSLNTEYLVRLSQASANASGDNCAELNAMLSQIFSSIACVNHLFLLRPDKPAKTSYSRPNLDYRLVHKFYCAVLEGKASSAGASSRPPLISASSSSVEFDRQVSKALMTKMIALLKRPRQTFDTPRDLSFLLICLELPLLYKGSLFSSASTSTRGINSGLTGPVRPANMAIEILERVCGLLIHSSEECQHYLLNWLIRTPAPRFQPKVDVLNAYVSHQLTYHYREKRKRRISLMQKPPAPRAVLGTNPANRRDGSEGLQALMSRGPNFGSPRDDDARKKRSRPVIKTDVYADDWRIHVFVRVLAIYFNANVLCKQKVPISSFYNTMVDFTDVLKDFEEWQRSNAASAADANDHHPALKISVSKSLVSPNGGQIFSAFTTTTPQDAPSGPGKLYFCKYPFLLSMGAKSEILEHDALRQMELEAQEAFFGSLLKKQPVSPYVNIRVRRSHLLQDSFNEFERHEGKFRKALRVEFVGESGVDAGGLKKEWFLLLFRQLFDAKTGYFYEEKESHYFWFDTNPVHSLKYYKLTGVAIGLALYNSTILDLNLPPVVFKKLLGHAYTLEDFVALKPSYGRSLKKLLEYDGDDFEDVFSLNFVVHNKDKVTGKVSTHELVGGGEGISVTKDNRQDYVRRIMTFYFDHQVRKQFEALKAGFCSIVEGNALMIFRPEEIELLVRGSLEPIDVDALRSVTKYHHWCPKGYNAESDPVIQWFWQYFRDLNPENQRKLLMFVTGSDRIPATGIANMPFRISRMGDDCDRLPTAHTCFNQICLYAYSSREKLYRKLEMAVDESQGFDMK